MLFLIFLNVFLYYLVFYPRKTLQRDSFYFTSYKFFKGGVIKKNLTFLTVKIMKPFLVNDRANNISFLIFINSLLLLMFFDLIEPFKSIVLSVNAASIFHYFVIIIPTERKKLAVSRDICIIIGNLATRDELLYKLLGNEPNLLSHDVNELSKLTTLLRERMGTKINCDVNSGSYLDLSYPEGVQMLNPEGEFKVFWQEMVRLDKDFFRRIFNQDLSLFPELYLAINEFYTQYSIFINFKEDINSNTNSISFYLQARKRLIATFFNTAANYFPNGSTKYKNFKV